MGMLQPINKRNFRFQKICYVAIKDELATRGFYFLCNNISH